MQPTSAMRPQNLLSILLGTAIGAGGWLHSLRVRQAVADSAPPGGSPSLAELRDRIEILERENRSLRSLAQGGGEIQVQPELLDFVEAAIGLDFRTSPVIHQIAGEELLQRVAASIESRFPPNALDLRQEAWARMGLLAPDDRFATQLAATYAIGARSWFDDQTGEAWVTHEFDPASIPDQAAVVRALARILLHQHFPPSPGYPGDEAERSRNALHHGTAIHLENRFLARQALALGFAGAQNRSGALDLLDNLPPFIHGLATFSSQTGATLAAGLVESNQLLDRLHDPPRSTAAVAGRDPSDSPPVKFPAVPDAILTESAGWLGLRLWLATAEPDAEGLADAWRADRYHLSARSDTQLDLVWEIVLADADAADRVATVAASMIGILAETEVAPPPGQAVTTPAGGQVRLTRPEPRRLRFTHLAAP